MRATKLAPLLLLIASPVLAVSKTELEMRIQKLEKKLNNQVVDIHGQMDGLRQEMQQLRGDLEVQAHEVQTLQKKQRELYLDIDRRLNNSGRTGSISYNSAGDQPQAPVPGSTNSADSEIIQQEYNNALEVLKQGQYESALVAFRKFLARYPDSSYADNAQYWIGEVYYVTRRFSPALKEFDKVINQYPQSRKIADARLKMGYINYELKKWAASRSALKQVVTDYPGSTPARLANERLQRMRKEGR